MPEKKILGIVVVIVVVVVAIFYLWATSTVPVPFQEAPDYAPDLPIMGCGDETCSGSENCSNCPQDCGECPPVEPPEDESIIKIAAWNLQVFGPTKASNDTLIEKYVSIMDDFDIIVVQGIQDESGEAFQNLCNMMEGYECRISERKGRTISKEQYGVIYKNADIVSVFDPYQYSWAETWERPLYRIDFEVENWTFILVTIHTKPDDVFHELKALEGFVSEQGSLWDIIILGDLNADCDYYNRQNNPTFPDPDNMYSWEFNWTWVIPDDADTTVSPNTDCAYDRIIVHEGKRYNVDNLIEYGIYDNITSDLSDRYLIWASFRINVG